MTKEYVNSFIEDLKRVRAREMEVLEKLFVHFAIDDQALFQRYMKLDTEVAQLGEKLNAHLNERKDERLTRGEYVRELRDLADAIERGDSDWKEKYQKFAFRFVE